MTPKPVDPLDEVLNALHEKLVIGWIRNDGQAHPIQSHSNSDSCTKEAKAQIQALIDAARVDELKRFTSSTGKRMKAETWQDWSWRVYHYCKDRIAQLTKSNEDKEV